jgi:radical SAM superfamily enzyme YgiQ (UPF0313 family)
MNILLFKLRGYIAEENRFGHRTWAEMPSNIATTAAYLTGQGFDVDIADDAVYPNERFGRYDVVAGWISVADGLFEGLDYLRIAKRAGCKTALVLFDDFAGVQRQILTDYSFVDYGVRRWDVETTLAKLLKHIQSGERYDFRGLVRRMGDLVVDNGEAIHHPENLHHLVSSRAFLERLVPTSYEQFAVRVGSGCPFKCTFCHIGDRDNRYRRIEDVLEELACIPQDSMVRVLSADLPQDTEWLRQFCEGIIARGIRIRWETDSRFTWLKDVEFLKLMRRSGCVELAIGLESYHPDLLKAYKKGYKHEIIEDALKVALQAGITPSLNMMIGHPLENEETLRTTESFLRGLSTKKDVKLIGIQYLRPLPGTKISRELEQHGLLKRPLTYKDFFASRDEPVVPTLALSKSEIVAWRDRLVAAYFA